MDCIPDDLTSTVQFSFTDLYKYAGKTKTLSQQERRTQFLEEQKEKRHRAADGNRELLELSDDDGEKGSPKRSRGGFRFNLMLSEWLVEVPDDLDDKWLVKFAPEGFRVLLMAKKAHTVIYTSAGRVCTKLRTNFPGGGKNSAVNTTVLDCIYNSSTNTFFVLDCLYWNSMSMLDSDASFRFYWLKTKFNEMPELSQCQLYKFVLLDYFPAQRPLMQDILFNQLEVDGHNYSYDGVVFYHKESHYTFGHTPLVGWLASYMLPEKLQIDVSAENTIRKPEDYVCVETYLEELRKKKRKGKQKPTDNSMEVL